MVKKSRKNRRGIPNGVQKHKISFRRDHHKKESNWLSSILAGSKHRIAQFLSVCWNNGFGYSSLLSLIPFVRNKSTGSFQNAPLYKRALHYTFVAFYGLILLYKFYAAIITASTNGPGLVTYLSFLSFIASLVGSCSAVGSTWLSGQMCAVLNSWQPLVRGLNEETGSRRTCFDNSGGNLKAAITFVTCSLAGIDVALFSLIDDLPVCVLPTVASFGAFNLSQRSSTWLRIAFLPLELLVMVPPMFASGLSGMTAMIGIGVFKMYLQEVRRLSIHDKKSWTKVYKLYRAIQMYNRVFMTWFKYMIVPVLFGCSCGIILLVYITIRPSGLHPFIYCWFPIITVVLVINITLLCYDCVTIKRMGDEVLELLQSKMHVHQLGLLNVDKQACLRMGKSLRSVYLAIGDFSEVTLTVPTGIWEEVINQLLFLLSL